MNNAKQSKQFRNRLLLSVSVPLAFILAIVGYHIYTTITTDQQTTKNSISSIYSFALSGMENAFYYHRQDEIKFWLDSQAEAARQINPRIQTCLQSSVQIIDDPKKSYKIKSEGCPSNPIFSNPLYIATRNAGDRTIVKLEWEITYTGVPALAYTTIALIIAASIGMIVFMLSNVRKIFKEHEKTLAKTDREKKQSEFAVEYLATILETGVDLQNTTVKQINELLNNIFTKSQLGVTSTIEASSGLPVGCHPIGNDRGKQGQISGFKAVFYCDLNKAIHIELPPHSSTQEQYWLILQRYVELLCKRTEIAANEAATLVKKVKKNLGSSAISKITKETAFVEYSNGFVNIFEADNINKCIASENMTLKNANTYFADTLTPVKKNQSFNIRFVIPESIKIKNDKVLTFDLKTAPRLKQIEVGATYQKTLYSLFLEQGLIKAQ